jgi:nucleoside-diphosphate kinase
MVSPAGTQRTFVLLKPDTVRRGLAGAVLGRLEGKGMQIVDMQLRQVDGELADQHYAEHLDRDFYPPLRKFITSGPSIAMIVEGDQAIEVVRALLGPTDGRQAPAGTIRGDYSLSNRENLAHGSDSPAAAEREIALWFPDHG